MKFLVNLLAKHNLTLATCESLTGGLFASKLAKIPGVGKIFKGGLVVYSNEAKIK
ncbi:MAG: CinA family protein, partial [Candidatus Moeniiplasma glomeromycotorum]|nr:CinA family protein [Candidatus Moeniiplasma glomeromycotorum]